MCSGKSTIREIIMNEFPEYKHYAFGDKIKEIARDIFDMDDKTKDRKLLTKIGTKMREIDEDVWVNYVLKQLKSDDSVIIDDLRYQ